MTVNEGTPLSEGWTTLRTDTLHQGRRMSLLRDEITRPNGTPGAFVYLEQPDGVRVVALDDHNRVALIEEDVYVCGRRLLLVPGGGCETGEAPEQAAARELAEEAGITADKIRLLTPMWRMPASVRTREHLFLARGLHLGEPHRESTETDMTVHWTPLDEAAAMCRDGRITEAGTLTAILLTTLALADPSLPESHSGDRHG
ncbi:NUDIX domain-containing protein [Streptacidiphilus sp. MAP5-52]|uniref:NUDIX domain-containing protein n=1 Tax=Streptacidiphilus sp. MAP5-52 TaxID=3156267 RepID=UPI003513B29E